MVSWARENAGLDGPTDCSRASPRLVCPDCTASSEDEISTRTSSGVPRNMLIARCTSDMALRRSFDLAYSSVSRMYSVARSPAETSALLCGPPSPPWNRPPRLLLPPPLSRGGCMAGSVRAFSSTLMAPPVSPEASRTAP